MRSGFVLRIGLPKLAGDNFTLNYLSHEPERSEKTIDGQPFVLFTWRSVLAVVKPGTFPLSAEAPLTVKIRTRPRRESALDDQFGDPFWQNFFGASIPKDITVASPPQELKVLELPAEDRPSDFHGAIGSFNIETDISPVKAEAGDPLTLRMRVVGSGNFDRVDSSMLDHVDQWKTYPPKSTFKSTDPIGHKGEKTFEQPLIALKPGQQTLPALTFSYFDPNTRRYETARGSPLSVTISPSLADSTLTAPQAGASGAATSVNTSAGGLHPDHAITETLLSSVVPLYLQPRFLAVPSILTLAFAAGWLLARRRKNPEIPAGNRIVSQAAKRAFAQMEAAARGGNATLFFNSARAALQQSLAARWQVPLDQITAAEVEARMADGGEDVRQLFALADETNYSGRELSSVDFAGWVRAVRRRMAERVP
jgi:hypothetical protein